MCPFFLSPAAWENTWPFSSYFLTHRLSIAQTEKHVGWQLWIRVNNLLLHFVCIFFSVSFPFFWSRKLPCKPNKATHTQPSSSHAKRGAQEKSSKEKSYVVIIPYTISFHITETMCHHYHHSHHRRQNTKPVWVRAPASVVVNTHKSYYSHSFIYSCNKYVLWYTIHIYL